MKQPSLANLAARILEVVVGLYFIAGAVPKALDVDKFMVQMAAYKVIERPSLLLPAVLATLFVEAALGLALIVGLRFRGLTVAAMQAMLAVFTALIVYAWLVHDLKDCGCFPVIQMSPPVSIVKNVLIAVAGLFFWWKLVIGATGRMHNRCSIVLKGTFCVLLGCVFAAYGWQGIDHAAVARYDDHSEGGIFSQFQITLPDGVFDLGQGIYLVPIMGASCLECRGKVPELNDLWAIPGLPPMIALCYEDTPGDLDDFINMTMPHFPAYSFGDRALLYFTLIDKEPFKLALVYNGRQVEAWEGIVPDYEDILDAVEALNIVFPG